VQNLRRHINKFSAAMDDIPRDAYKQFKNETPIDTGNARRNTEFKGGKSIVGDYPYANRLNEGHSRQARNGMTEPTIDFIRDTVRKIL